MKKHLLIFALICPTLSSAVWCVDQPVKAEIPDYSRSDRAAVPEAFRWRLEDIYPTLAAWQADLITVKPGLDRFTTLIDAGVAVPASLADALELQEKLNLRLEKLQGYASLQSQVQWQDARFRDMQSEATLLSTVMNAQSLRLEACLSELDENKLPAVVNSEPRLAPYRASLQRALAGKSHRLSLEAGRVVSQVGLFSDGPRVAADCLRDLDMPKAEAVLPDGTKLPLTVQNWWKLSLSSKALERRAAQEAWALNRKHYENTFAALLDMGVKRDLFSATVRHYPDCLSAELQPYGVSSAVYRTMVQTVRGNLAPYYRFLRLRKKMLGLPELRSSDGFLPTVPGSEMRFSFAEARSLTEESLRPLGREYADLVRRAFDGHWFDVYMHKDKMNFGSAQSLKGVHPFINLDFRGSFFDLITVTHELGHALNFYLAEKSQPFAAADVVWFASEIPSTFNEVLLMKHMLEQTKDERLKLALLAQLLQRLNVLLFFDVQNAEMQLAMHEHVEKGGTLAPAWLNAKQLELTRHYLGHDLGVVKVDDYVQGEWNHPSMFFSPFQSYFYAVGAAMALALADPVAHNPEAAKKYLTFLKTGSSRPILDVLKELGVDLTTSKPWLDALAAYNRLVERMEILQARVARQEK